MSELTEAAMTALLSRRCAHSVVHARTRRSLVATFCFRWGPAVSKVTPSILIMPEARRWTRVGEQPWP